MAHQASHAQNIAEAKAFVAILKESKRSGKGSLKKVKTHLDKVILGK